MIECFADIFRLIDMYEKELARILMHRKLQLLVGRVFRCDNSNGPRLELSRYHADDMSTVDIGLCLHCIGNCTLSNLLLKLDCEDLQQFKSDSGGVFPTQKK